MRFLSRTIRPVAVAVLSGSVLSVATASGPVPFIDVHSDGSDGVLHPTADLTIDLATAGTYDPSHWRVVFHYQSVNIPAGVTVTFLNHPSRAPVVWLSQSDVVIAGSVRLNGDWGSNYTAAPFYAEPGPGGFRGGLAEPAASSWLSSSGFGPGGGYQHQTQWWASGGGAGHRFAGVAGAGAPAGVQYGAPSLMQLIGGSGGAAGRGTDALASSGGGAGGGAILIAANGSIEVGDSGVVTANGGEPGFSNNVRGGGGSGGAIRLLADRVSLASGARVEALGGDSVVGTHGAPGRIRIEANTFEISTITQPAFVQGPVGSSIPLSTDPTVTVISVGGQSAPLDPRAFLGEGGLDADVSLSSGVDAQIVIETTNVPLDAAVYLRFVGARRSAYEVRVTDGITNPLVEVNPGSGDFRARTSWATSLAAGVSAIQARVVLPVQ